MTTKLVSTLERETRDQNRSKKEIESIIDKHVSLALALSINENMRDQLFN